MSRNPLADEVGRLAANLAPGVYRLQLTVCALRIGVDGLERAAEVVIQYCQDFEARPPAPALPAMEVTP